MKNTVKRSISLLLALMLLLSMAACAAPTQEENPEASSSTSAGPEYSLPLEEGYNQVTFYWKHASGIENCDMWIWWAGKDGTGNIFYPCEYGGKVVVNVPEAVSEIGFIVRRNCSDPGGTSWGNATKDYESDRFALITGKETVIYLKPGDANQYMSNDGGKTLQQIRDFSMAGMVDFNTIQYFVTPATTLNTLEQIKVTQDGQQIAIQSVDTLGKSAASGKITLAEKLDLSKTYEVELTGFGKKSVMPTGIFDSQEFLDNYTYDGDDLGAVIKGKSTTFKVWAPTASAVKLNLFTAGNDCEAFASVDMVKGEKGV